MLIAYFLYYHHALDANGSRRLSVSLSVGQRVPTGFQIQQNQWLYYLFKYDYSWHCDVDIEVELKADGTEYCHGLSRGMIDQIQRKLLIKDPFNLLSLVMIGPSIDMQIQIEPRQVLGNLEQFSLASTGGGGDLSADGTRNGDLTDYRPYQIGDPLHRVLWSLSDRMPNGELLVRQAEKTSNQKIAIYLLIDQNDSAAASVLAYHAETLCTHQFIYVSSSQDHELYSFDDPDELIHFLVERPNHRQIDGWSIDAFIETCIREDIKKGYVLGSNQNEILDFSHFDNQVLDLSVWRVGWQTHNHSMVDIT